MPFEIQNLESKIAMVPFKELGGSPIEHYTAIGFTAQRQFLIAWDDRDAFAAALLGNAALDGGSAALPYPGKTSVLAVAVRYEPFDADNPDFKDLGDLTEGLNSYSNSFAKATVDYQTITPQDRKDGPQVQPGTQLTYDMSFVSQNLPMLPDGWQWADNPAIPLPANLALTKTVPVTQHNLVWHQVVSPPWSALSALQGKVNAGTFLGCPAGTVLFAGATAKKLLRSGVQAATPELAWELSYTFREKAIKQGGQVFGWNCVYRPSPPGWVELTNGANPLYDLADFSPLFQPAR